MTRARAIREVLILCVTALALYNAGRAIYNSVDRQVLLAQANGHTQNRS